MHQADEQPYLPRQVDAAIRSPERTQAAPCVTTGIGRDGLLVRGAPRLPAGSQVEVTLTGDRRGSLTIQCIAGGLVGLDQILTYHGLAFDQRVRLEELVQPHWDGIDLLDGLMTMSCLYGATTLKDWLCMTTLLERLQPHILHRPSTAA